MKGLDFTLLEQRQVYGSHRLSIFDKYGTKAAITDFAILLGSFIYDDYTNEGNELKDRTNWWWTKTPYNNNAIVVNQNGYRDWNGVYLRYGGARPVISYSSIINQSLKGRINNLGVYEVEYGEYPQTIVNESLSNELERLYKGNKLRKTGKKYSTDSVDWRWIDLLFEERKHIEYEHNGEKYIRILGDINSEREILSDGRIVEKGKPYFVKVEPIVWLIDKEKDISVTKKLLFSGVQFNNICNYNGDFNLTDLHYFLENYFREDIIPSKIENIIEESEKITEEAVSNEKDDIEIVPYIVKYENSDETFGAFELNGILRDIITSFKIVNKLSQKSNDTLKCASKKKTTFTVLASHYLNDLCEIERLEYAKKICELGKNSDLYDIYLEQVLEKNKKGIEEKCKEKVTEYVRGLQLK